MRQKKLLNFGIIVLLMFLQVQGFGQEVPKIRVDQTWHTVEQHLDFLKRYNTFH